MFALLISLGQATVYVLTGLYGQPRDLGAGVCLLLIIQPVAPYVWFGGSCKSGAHISVAVLLTHPFFLS